MAGILLVILVTLIIVSCTNKIEKARQLLDEEKQDEAISVLSTLEKDDKQYSEAQHLIKYAKSKNVFNDALRSYNNNDFESALEYFNKVDVVDSFSNLKTLKEASIAGITLVRNLPGTYEGTATQYLGGAYMIINTKMKILQNLAYTIQEQMTDTYAGGFYSDLYSGEVKPVITKFKSGEYGFILNLKPWGSPYKKNDFSVYFYRYANYWRLQFNLEFTWGSSTQNYTLNLFREAKFEKVNENNIEEELSSSLQQNNMDNTKTNADDNQKNIAIIEQTSKPKEQNNINEENPRVPLGEQDEENNLQIYYTTADKMPEPIGGISAIYKNIVYPEIAKRAGIEGTVNLLVFINKEGAVIDVKNLKGIGAGCDEAAIEAINKTKFSPGMQDGKAANVQFLIPIKFKLN